jgi:hypothetical protein
MPLNICAVRHNWKRVNGIDKKTIDRLKVYNQAYCNSKQIFLLQSISFRYEEDDGSLFWKKINENFNNNCSIYIYYYICIELYGDTFMD